MNCQSTAGGFLVAAVHVLPGFSHCIDHLIQRDHELTVSCECEIRRGDGFNRPHAIAFDAGHLYQATNRITGQSEAVFYGDLCRILDLSRAAAIAAVSPAAAMEAAAPTSP